MLDPAGAPESGGAVAPGQRVSRPTPCRGLLKRSSIGTQKNCNASFKSPIQSPSSSLNAGTKEGLQQDIEDLRQKDSALDKELHQLMAEGYSIEELDEHISLLHEYNDLKDAGQMLMGRLALAAAWASMGNNAFHSLEVS